MKTKSFIIDRAVVQKLFDGNPRAVAQFEEFQRTVAENSEVTTAQVDATTALQDATFLTLSPNADLSNEYVLALGEGLRLVLEDGEAKLFIDAALADSGHSIRFVTTGDTLLALPLTGFVATREWFPGPYADDAGAATGGVAVGECYRKGTTASSVPATRMV